MLSNFQQSITGVLETSDNYRIVILVGGDMSP